MNDDIKTLERNDYMTLATVSEDGSPWATPVKFGYHDGLVYWRSDPAATHSQNIERDGRVSMSVYDPQSRPGFEELQAVYIQSQATRLDDEQTQDILQKIGDMFSDKDTHSPVYGAPIGKTDQQRSSDNRFYRFYDAGNGVER